MLADQDQCFRMIVTSRVKTALDNILIQRSYCTQHVLAHLCILMIPFSDKECRSGQFILFSSFMPGIFVSYYFAAIFASLLFCCIVFICFSDGRALQETCVAVRQLARSKTPANTSRETPGKTYPQHCA